MCPRCHQNAPLVYRGVNAFCTACGAPRMPLAASSVNMAGQPAKVGGTLARVFGWLVLAVGWLLALALGGIFYSLWPLGVAHWLVGGPIALVATLIAWALLRGGKRLHASGALTEMTTKNQAIFALATTRGGVLTAWDLAQSIGTTFEDADATLTKLAKEYPDWVTVDGDDEGNVLYRFPPIHWRNLRQRVGTEPTVRVDAREPMPAEVPIDEAAEAVAERRHAR